MFLSRVIIRDVRSSGAYSHHQRLWQLFPGVSKDRSTATHFLFQHTPKIHPQCFLVLSQEQPTPHESFQIESKPFLPEIQNGELLQFSLRANPVVTRNKKRNDIVADWKYQFKQDWEAKNPEQDFPGFPALGHSQAQIVNIECRKWLEKQGAKHGFEIKNCLAESYHQHGFYKGDQKQGVKISTVDFSGVLKVTDYGAFKKILFGGLGPAKGFGCGLLLIRRINCDPL